MKIFVTGGTGFVGIHTVRRLYAEGDQLLLLSTRLKQGPSSLIPKDIPVVEGNLSNVDPWRKEVEAFRPEAVIHMAWEGIPSHDADVSIKNLQYGLNAVYLAVELGCASVLGTGTCWEYGLQTGKASEDIPPRPLSAFGAAKIALSWLGAEIAKEHDIRFIWTRPFYIYGPGQRAESLMPYLIRCAKEDTNPGLRNPSASNDFIYVGDVAEAIALLLKNARESGVYNIASGAATRVEDIAELIFREFNRPFEYHKAEPLLKDSFSGLWADIAKIKQDVSWQPKTSLAEGVKKTVEHYKQQLA